MKKTIIHVFTDNSTIEYFYYMRDNYLFLSSGNVDFYCYTFDDYTYNKLQNKFQTYILKKELPSHIAANKFLADGYLHYIMLKKAFENFDKDSINIIADADTAMLCKNWDVIIKEKLENNYCIGCNYCTGVHYFNIPCVIWMAFDGKTNYSIKEPFPYGKELNDTIVPLTEQECYIYNVPMRNMSKYNFDSKYKSFIVADPGWDFPVFMKENNFNYFTFIPKTRFHKDRVLNKFCDDQYVEYWINNLPIMAHMTTSRGYFFRQSNHSDRFYDNVDSYLRKLI